MDWKDSTITKESDEISVWKSVMIEKSPAFQRGCNRLSGLSHKRGQGKSLQ